MKNIIYIILLVTSSIVTGQTKESDYFSFYKGGNKYLRPIKYLLFDNVNGNEKKENENKIYFYVGNQTFIFNSSKDEIDTCAVNYLKKIKLDFPDDLQKDAYKYYKEKKREEEKKMNLKNPILFPVKDFSTYFKIYILEKIADNKVVKYEVKQSCSEF
ncbi:hypothetical protein [Flavobacterium sp. AJR]|uniref:hypothetical protein n=1 Tax=unclassified Flavobacterium TaxID=196869 RepID=UPI000A3D86DF|nr:hypothetical protein [Flavobacterium sp. AJR]OUL64270.1 hypothetical protein B8T70_00830 [Flavobacterium sp. AJR]